MENGKKRTGRPKIVIMDGYTINPGDLTWQRLYDMGDCDVYTRTDPEQVIERCRDRELILTSKVIFDADVMDQLPKLRYIGVMATGYNNVDVSEAARRGITVTNVPAYSTESVAQMVFALLLELCVHVKEHNDSVKDGAWSICRNFCYWKRPVIELAGKTMGIYGFGRIGQQTGRIASAMGMRVLVYSRTRKEMDTGYRYEWADSREELFSSADVLTLHCPLFPETEHMMNEETLQLMKPTAFLINTARGPLIDEDALAKALHNHVIAGAAIDVMEQEPPRANHPLYTEENCIITPHIAWASKEARGRLVEIICDNVKGFLEGEPQNVVN